jgi:hypothetical protein
MGKQRAHYVPKRSDIDALIKLGEDAQKSDAAKVLSLKADMKTRKDALVELKKQRKLMKR